MNIKKQSGFTLIELLLYTSMAAIILSIVAGFLFISLNSRVKNQTIAEVDGQGIQVLQAMTQEIRNATIITSPTIGASASSLSLDGGNIVFGLLDGQLRIDRGVSELITSDNVVVSDLVFTNLSQPDTTGTIRIEFNINYQSESKRHEYNYQKTFYGSATVLNN